MLSPIMYYCYMLQVAVLDYAQVADPAHQSAAELLASTKYVAYSYTLLILDHHE